MLIKLITTNIFVVGLFDIEVYKGYRLKVNGTV